MKTLSSRAIWGKEMLHKIKHHYVYMIFKILWYILPNDNEEVLSKIHSWLPMHIGISYYQVAHGKVLYNK